MELLHNSFPIFVFTSSLTPTLFKFYLSSCVGMGLKHSREVREALPKQVDANGTSQKTALCNCSPCNCNPCRCPEKSITANGSPVAVSEEAKPCQEFKEGEDVKCDSQCHDVPEVNADEGAQDPPTPPKEGDDQPTPDAEDKPVIGLTTSPVVDDEKSTMQAEIEVVVGSTEQP